MMKAAAKRILKNFHLLEPSRRLQRRIDRRFGLLERKIAARYLARSDAPKLHIGCGGHPLPDWLNTDYLPDSPDIMHLDATRPFPFMDETFDYVVSEHMIEHFHTATA